MQKPFHEKRRQVFLTEENFIKIIESDKRILERQCHNLTLPEDGEHGWHVSLLNGIAESQLDTLILGYTAGESIEPMRYALEDVVAAYERYATKLREYEDDPNAMAFPIRSFDGYCPYIWLISLCYLLHRRDLLPRVALLVDGLDEENAGEDVLIEELLSYSNDLERYETNTILGVKPYRPLFRAFKTKTNDEAIIKLQEFLKDWYRDLAAAPWHDSHKEGGGYYGYWAFEAAAAVILLGIEDDSSLHQYLYYPKDIVEFARTFKPDVNDISLKPQSERLRVEGGQACTKTGYWSTPALKDSRRQFKQGEIMPKFESEWGQVIWQFEGNE